jgi:aspartate/glutamate racemase
VDAYLLFANKPFGKQAIRHGQVGLIGGSGPAAAVLLYEHIARVVAQAVLLSGTDLRTVYDHAVVDFQVIDSARLNAHAIAEVHLRQP